MKSELALSNIQFEVQAPLSVEYKGIRLDCGYRVDLLVEKKLILELKVVEKFLPIHEALIGTYMKLARASVALLINFNVELLKEGGIKRFVLRCLRVLRTFRGGNKATNIASS